MKRLKSILPFLKGFNTLLDVGTDHGKLPVMALNQDLIKKAYASDNKEGPLNAAKKTLLENDLFAKITLLKGDGLEILEEDVDVCVIAGMGGKTIQKMLINADFKNIKRFIIQATNHLNSVRVLTVLKALHLKEEILIMDKDIPYITMVFERESKPLNEKECYFGTHLIDSKNLEYKKLLEKDYQFLNQLLSQIKEDKQPKEMVKKRMYLKEILDEWT